MSRIIIIGAGPAGIFSALTLLDRGVKEILLLDRGKDIEQRVCPARTNHGECIHCNPCSTLSGWGGAGAFSDGKLTLTTQVRGLGVTSSFVI